jgi:hypothetical protein
MACGPTRRSQAHHRTGPRLLPRHPSQTRTTRPPDQQAQRHPDTHSAWIPGHGASNAEYDLTVVSLASKDARATYLPNQDSDPSRLVNKYLDSVADHKVRHRPRSNLPFHPIVLSLGGMMNGSTTKVFASWKRVMTRGTYNLMLKRLSLCLLQARVRSFALLGFHTTVEPRRPDRHAMHPLTLDDRRQGHPSTGKTGTGEWCNRTRYFDRTVKRVCFALSPAIPLASAHRLKHIYCSALIPQRPRCPAYLHP